MARRSRSNTSNSTRGQQVLFHPHASTSTLGITSADDAGVVELYEGVTDQIRLVKLLGIQIEIAIPNSGTSGDAHVAGGSFALIKSQNAAGAIADIKAYLDNHFEPGYRRPAMTVYRKGIWTAANNVPTKHYLKMPGARLTAHESLYLGVFVGSVLGFTVSSTNQVRVAMSWKGLQRQVSAE